MVQLLVSPLFHVSVCEKIKRLQTSNWWQSGRPVYSLENGTG